MASPVNAELRAFASLCFDEALTKISPAKRKDIQERNDEVIVFVHEVGSGKTTQHLVLCMDADTISEVLKDTKVVQKIKDALPVAREKKMRVVLNVLTNIQNLPFVGGSESRNYHTIALASPNIFA